MLKANRERIILTVRPFLDITLINFNPKLLAIEKRVSTIFLNYRKGLVVFHFIFTFYHVLSLDWDESNSSILHFFGKFLTNVTFVRDNGFTFFSEKSSIFSFKLNRVF